MIVPGFNHRFPKEGDDDYLWSFADCHAKPDTARPLMESCCTTLEEALTAQTRGADRIELCTDLSVGGLTPPRDLIRNVVSTLSIPVNVLIRPSSRDALCGSLRNRLASLDPSQAEPGPLPLTSRGWLRVSEGSTPALVSREEGLGFSAEDFVYDETVLQEMMGDIEYCKKAGTAGIVVGALTPDGAIDLPAMRRLVAAAAPLPVTFHRAFDVCTEDPFTALDQLISLGCVRLLSSGRQATAWEGRNLLRLLVRRASQRIIIMPGSGVTPGNLPALAAATLAAEFHGTRIP